VNPDEVAACLARTIALWHGVPAPSPAGVRELVQLEAAARSLRAVWEQVSFEDAPGSFAAVLDELAD
jgi:hypothetical protein